MPDEATMAQMEANVKGIGHAIGKTIDTEFGKGTVGFCVLLFTFNKEGEEGWSTYISNAEPRGMISALRELAALREAELDEHENEQAGYNEPDQSRDTPPA